MADRSTHVPHSRRDGLVVRRLGDEALVYDETNHEAHHLSALGHLVWRHCDGRRTVDDVLRIAALAIAPAPSRADVERTLRELRDVDLVRDQPPAKPYERRVLMRQLGVAAIAVTSVMTQSAMASASVTTTVMPTSTSTTAMPTSTTAMPTSTSTTTTSTTTAMPTSTTTTTAAPTTLPPVTTMAPLPPI